MPVHVAAAVGTTDRLAVVADLSSVLLAAVHDEFVVAAVVAGLVAYSVAADPGELAAIAVAGVQVVVAAIGN